MLDLPEEQLAAIKKILREYVPEHEVRAFGSRLNAKAKSYSDLDLVVVGEKKLERSLFIRLKEAFEESNLPFRIDLLDWNRISPDFRKIIEKDSAVLQSPLR